MFDIKKILTDNGVSSEVVDTIANTIKAEIPKEFVSKVQYRKKTDEVDNLNGKIADLEIEVQKAGTDEYKSKYETLEADFNTYKADIENGKTLVEKTNLVKAIMTEQGFKNERLANLLLKDLDLNNIEIEGGKIKDTESLVKNLNDNYSDFKTTTEVGGNPPATPPANNGGTAKYTLESIKGMSSEQIKQNYEAIQKDLALN